MNQFAKGQILFTRGLNMQCRPVSSRCVFVRYLNPGERGTEHGFDCVTESRRVKVLGKSADLFADLESLRAAAR